MDFEFQQFSINQKNAAHKVGTDGVLLGAWASPENPGTVLDIGAGTGLVSLMMAQRFPASQITGVEIDRESAYEASQNFGRSKWVDRLSLIHSGIQDVSLSSFNCIVSNPPFYVNRLNAPNTRRNKARHTISLSFVDLFSSVDRLLSAEGSAHMILPYDQLNRVRIMAIDRNLYIQECVAVSNKPTSEPIRALLSFKRRRIPPSTEKKIVIRNEDGAYSDDYISLTRDFYLFNQVRG